LMDVIIPRLWNLSNLNFTNMKKINARLLEERKRLGLNKGQMASAGGVANSSYTNYEDGKRSPDGEFLAAIAASGADVQYILTGIRSSNAEQAKTDLPPRRRALLDNIEHCSEEDQRAIERMALLAAKASSGETAETADGQEKMVNQLRKSA